MKVIVAKDYEAASKAAADIDSNSQIDSSDALAILRHSVGIGVNDRIGKTIIDVTDK